nr:hypothetical protein [uncultured Flavobacterium sp.]
MAKAIFKINYHPSLPPAKAGGNSKAGGDLKTRYNSKKGRF